MTQSSILWTKLSHYYLVNETWIKGLFIQPSKVMKVCANATISKANAPNSIAKASNSIAKATNWSASATNSTAKALNYTANGTNSTAKVLNSTANGTKSTAKVTNSLAETCSISKLPMEIFPQPWNVDVVWHSVKLWNTGWASDFSLPRSSLNNIHINIRKVLSHTKYNPNLNIFPS